MVDRMVFNKIQDFLNTIDTDKNSIISKNELSNDSIPSIWMKKIQNITKGQDMSREEIIMGLGVEHAEDDDVDHSHYGINKEKKYRFKTDNDDENYQRAFEQAKFFVERNIEKWFSVDINSNGYTSNIEIHRWDRKNDVPDMNDGDLDENEYADKYRLDKTSESHDNLNSWHKDWKEDTIYGIAYDYGVTFSKEDLNKLEEYAIIQMNRKLVKPGQGDTASLYNRLGSDAYTRIVTNEQTVSCCGGDITPPPMTSDKKACNIAFSSINSVDDTNTADEVQNRLAWAIFKTPPEEFLNKSEDAITVWQDMPDNMYQQYHEQWNQIRNMKAADFRELLKPENEHKKNKFEQNSNMSVKQIVDYIDIVEKVTDHNFDDKDWKINAKQFQEICTHINGTYGDETVLDGKTKKDILPERQELYNYLKENNLLLPQFME